MDEEEGEGRRVGGGKENVEDKKKEENKKNGMEMDKEENTVHNNH